MCEIAIFRPQQGRKKGPPCTPVLRSYLSILRRARLLPGRCPDAAGRATQAESIPTTNPHAQVTKMAFAWSKNQTPSNYYYYYYYYQ